jgi:hypothetical protein
LRGIHDYLETFVLFEMCPREVGEQVLADTAAWLAPE